MAEVIYINTEEDEKGSHNKFWSYEIIGSEVTYRWGRVGQKSLGKPKPYDERAHQKLIQEKIKKGYKLASKEKLKAEVETAHELGTRYKIKSCKFARREAKVTGGQETLHRLDRYDPNHYVVVEVINSWQKSITRLLLSKTETFEIIGGVTEFGDKIGVNRVETPTGQAHSFANAVRNYLKRLSQTVTAIVKKVSFAALGRNLFGDDDAEENAVAISSSPSYLDEIAKIDSAGVDTSVISTFASMGRALEF